MHSQRLQLISVPVQLVQNISKPISGSGKRVLREFCCFSRECCVVRQDCSSCTGCPALGWVWFHQLSSLVWFGFTGFLISSVLRHSCSTQTRACSPPPTVSIESAQNDVTLLPAGNCHRFTQNIIKGFKEGWQV